MGHTGHAGAAGHEAVSMQRVAFLTIPRTGRMGTRCSPVVSGRYFVLVCSSMIQLSAAADFVNTQLQSAAACNW